jgi:thiol:disulfide interchange protein DsbD
LAQSGDSGEATAITWQLPPGFTAGPIHWPTPHRIPVGPLANYGYDGETTLLTEITAPADLAASGQVPINADVTWLVCEKECIPGEAHLSLTLPAVAAGRTPPESNAETRARFEAARATIPQPSLWKASMQVVQDTLTLRVAASNLKPQAIRSAQFFPFSETLIRHAEPQTLAVSDAGLSLELVRSALTIGTPKDVRGVLVIDEAIGSGTARHAFELGDVAVATAAPIGSPAMILQAALFAVLGGLILNLMPCVFPVLSIKVLSLINHAGQSAGQLRRHGIVYTAGVLTTFLVLAGVLLALRAGGTEVGWGFQLQSPVTVAVLAYVLFAMGLSLSGVFHFGYSLQALGGNLAHRSGLSGSFFAGALAVAVATPCTAPFMGTALGFALTQPAAVSLVVFLALGLGLALPFLLLTLAPQLVGRLPRPGAWMETLKQALAFPIYATVAWLMWVLGQQVGPSGLFAALIGLVLVALAAWSLSIWQTSATWGRRVAAAVRGRIDGNNGGRSRQPAARPCRHLRHADGICRRHRALYPTPPRRAARREPTGVRQHDSCLVHHLPRQRARRPVDGRGQAGLCRQQHRLPEGRLDQPQSGDHPHPGPARQKRRSALPSLCRHRRARGLAANPYCCHRAAGDRSHSRTRFATQSRLYDFSQGVNA